MISKILKYVISHKVLRKIAVETLRKLNNNAFNISTLKTFNLFEDEVGNVIQLKEGLRSMIKPGWQLSFKDVSVKKIDAKDIAVKSKEIKYFIMTMTNLLSKIRSKRFNDILEIGSYDSIKSAYLANMWPESNVISSDIDYYYDSENLEVLRENRKLIYQYFNVNNVKFDIDDITRSNYDNDSFDLIFSSDVLEHVDNLVQGFNELYRITKPGGFGYHVYNPFFSYNGGHTYATLDFPFGHACLSSDDFKKYLNTFRPDEFDKACDFYFRNINRCTLKEMKEIVENSGFHIHAFLKESKMNQVKLLDENTLSMVQRLYPDATLEDLLSPVVILVVEKLK